MVGLYEVVAIRRCKEARDADVAHCRYGREVEYIEVRALAYLLGISQIIYEGERANYLIVSRIRSYEM